MNILLFGRGGHCKVVSDMVERQGIHRIVGIVSHDGIPSDSVPGYEVVAGNDNFETVLPDLNAEAAIVALGNTQQRMVLVDRIAGLLEFVTAVDPSAFVSRRATIGEGTVVMPGVIVNSGTVIGNHCILNTACSVDHDCTVGDFSHVCPGVHVAGHVVLGRECWLSTGSAVIPHTAIGDRVTAAAGSVVTKPVGNDCKVRGIPAECY